MMYVKKVSNATGDPVYARVTIMDGTFELEGYCYPFKSSEGQKFYGWISMEIDGDIKKVYNLKPTLEYISDNEVIFIAVVMDKETAYVGDMRLSIPDDLLEAFYPGEIVHFIGWDLAVVE